MQQIFDQLLQFLQEGIAAIFRFVRLIWTWSIGEISKVFHVPWENWPIWKQLLLVLIVAAVAWILFTAAAQLWAAGVRVLSAFASLLVALVVTLPTILIAGLVALGGLWTINNLNFTAIPVPAVFSGGESSSTQPSQTAGEKSGQPSGNRTGESSGTAQ